MISKVRTEPKVDHQDRQFDECYGHLVDYNYGED
jgi:hypothetical protein